MRKTDWTRMGNVIAIGRMAPEQLAHLVLAKYDHQHSIPVPIEEICREYNVSVFRMEFDDETVSGMIRRTENGASIYVNAKDTPELQRFTTAHELGHFLLHLDGTNRRGLIEHGDIQERYRRDGDHSPEERAANRFAAAVLMPDPVIQELGDIYPVESLAQFLAVSHEALKIRLRNA